MSELIARKLSTLPPGTQVSLTYLDGPTGHETATGTITENNFQDGLEILTDDGQELVLAYEEIRRLMVKKSNPGQSPSTGAAPQTQTQFNAQSPAQARLNPQSPARTPTVWQAAQSTVVTPVTQSAQNAASQTNTNQNHPPAQNTQKTRKNPIVSPVVPAPQVTTRIPFSMIWNYRACFDYCPKKIGGC